MYAKIAAALAALAVIGFVAGRLLATAALAETPWGGAAPPAANTHAVTQSQPSSGGPM